MKVTVICLTLACALLYGAVSYGAGIPTLPPTPKISWTPIPPPKVTVKPPIRITVRPIPTVVMPCPVSINEVMVNSTDRDDRVGEYIELCNHSMFEVDITDWSVSDAVGWGRIVDYTRASDLGVAGTVIPPYGYALIVDRDYDGMYNDAILDDENVDLNELIMVRMQNSDGSGEIGNGLANGGDTIYITTDYRKEDGSYATLTLSWGAQGHEGWSYQRCGDAWFTGQATPGGPNDGCAE